MTLLLFLSVAATSLQGNTGGWIIDGLSIAKYAGFDENGHIRPTPQPTRREISAVRKCASLYRSRRAQLAENAFVDGCLAGLGHGNLFLLADVADSNPH